MSDGFVPVAPKNNNKENTPSQPDNKNGVSSEIEEPEGMKDFFERLNDPKEKEKREAAIKNVTGNRPGQ